MNLIEMGYDLDYSETRRKSKDGEEDIIYSDFYLERDITDSELHMLIDGLLFSKYIPYSQCKALIKKLEKLSSENFQSRIGHIQKMPANMPENQYLLTVIEVLDEAMGHSDKVSFNLISYGTDKMSNVIIGDDGEPKRYTVSPYRIVVNNARYYLLCSFDEGDELYNFRLDYISNIKRLEGVPIRQLRKLKKFKDGLDLSKYITEHIYMYSGESVRVTFRADKVIVNQIIDWFGMGVDFLEDDGKEVTARVTVNENAMLFWALQYGRHVTVLEPDSLRNKIKKVIQDMNGRYE
jgi:predicted DNA-binding transcriptional regulator YafY